jgi:hypothetical protein
MKQKTAVKVAIGNWMPETKAPWSEKGYAEINDLDIFEFFDGLLAKQAVPENVSPKTISSYTSYIIQILKDADYIIQIFRAGGGDQYQEAQKVLDFSIDSAINKRQPWRFTYSALEFILNSNGLEEAVKNPDVNMAEFLTAVIEKGLVDEQVLSVEKYMKVAHVIIDYAFESGWHETYSRVLEMKVSEGLNLSVSRGLEIRQVALIMAFSFNRRGKIEGAREALALGFVDAHKLISEMEIIELTDLFKLTPKEALRTLLAAAQEHQISGAYSNIVAGVMRILSSADIIAS